MNLTIKLIRESVDSFISGQRTKMGSLEILMAPDVFNEVLPFYDEWFGFRKYLDNELPEGHIRIIGTDRHGQSKALFRVKGL